MLASGKYLPAAEMYSGIHQTHMTSQGARLRAQDPHRVPNPTRGPGVAEMRRSRRTVPGVPESLSPERVAPLSPVSHGHDSLRAGRNRPCQMHEQGPGLAQLLPRQEQQQQPLPAAAACCCCCRLLPERAAAGGAGGVQIGPITLGKERRDEDSWTELEELEEDILILAAS